MWKTRGKVPAEHCPAIERATKGAVRCEELRPDVAWDVLRLQTAPVDAQPAVEPAANTALPPAERAAAAVADAGPERRQVEDRRMPAAHPAPWAPPPAFGDRRQALRREGPSSGGEW